MKRETAINAAVIWTFYQTTNRSLQHCHLGYYDLNTVTTHTGQYQFNGGTLSTTQIIGYGINGTGYGGTFTFNGGTLQATASDEVV